MQKLAKGKEKGKKKIFWLMRMLPSKTLNILVPSSRANLAPRLIESKPWQPKKPS